MKALLFGMALLLAGCATAPVDYPPERSIGHWVGQPIETVIAAWGEPSHRQSVDGRDYYIWLTSHYTRSYFPANADLSASPLTADRLADLRCKGVMEVNDQGIVSFAEWQGEECY